MTDLKRRTRATTIALFPMGYFLENIALRADDSALVTAMNKNELWYVPAPGAVLPVEPVLVATFGEPTLDVIEVAPDVFCVFTSNIYTTHESYLQVVDLNGWAPGTCVETKTVFRFPEEARSLNGGCLIASNVMLAADCFGGCIWRIDLPGEGVRGVPTARVWLRHHSMDSDPNGPDWTQPGVNGIKYAASTGYVYYTSTEKQLFMRVAVDPKTGDPLGDPEFVSGGRMADDFIIDERGSVAYLTTHRQNTIDRVPLDPALNLDFARNSVLGNPFDEDLIGPSCGAWSRAAGEEQRKIAYFLTDGGTKSPPKSGAQRPKMLRIEL